MKQSKRVIGLLLAVVMLLSMVPVTFADDTARFPDFPTGWSKEAMTAAVNNGLLNGFEDGKIHPEANVTRAQFAAIIVRAFGAKTKANISAYSDVSTQAWYYSDIAKAVKMGALKGQSATEMAPDSPITRQEVFTAFARILVLSDDDTAALNKFNDKGEIASWAINHMAALAERGYVNGDPEGNVNPKALISREGFAQLMHNAIRTYITKAGTYTDDLDGIVVVRVGDVTLKGLKNSSDLVIGDGAGEGKIFIESVDIEKRLLARGGTIKVSKSTLGDFVVVNNVNGVTKFENYRSESFFKDIVENTTAKFLTRGGGGTPDIVYTLTLKLKDGTVWDKVTFDKDGNPDKNVSDIAIPRADDYYTFDGWYDGNKKVTDFKDVDFGINVNEKVLTAEFKPIEYTITYTKDTEYFVDFDWKTEPFSVFTIENIVNPEKALALPSKDSMNITTLGYDFDCLKYDGKKIESLSDIKEYMPKDQTANFEILVKFKLHEYRIKYKNVIWAEGKEPRDEDLVYTVLTVDDYKLAPGTAVVVPSDKAGQKFKYWKLFGTDEKIEKLKITEDTPDELILEPHFDYPPSDPVYITFYKKYSKLDRYKIGEPRSVERNNTLNRTEFPKARDYLRYGYDTDFIRKISENKNDNLKNLYKDKFVHEITPSFWYEKGGVLVPFDENVEIKEDINVYLSTKELGATLTVEGYEGLDLGVYPDYGGDTRIINTVKDILAVEVKKLINGASDPSNPYYDEVKGKYDEITGKLVDKMASTGLLEVDGNKKKIQNVKVPLKISTFVKEDVANGMIRTYLRDVVKNPAELDKIFTMINVSDFADQLGIDTIIANMSNAEIASLMKSSEHKNDIIDFVYSDLQKTDSSMMNFVIDYVTNDEDFRNKIIDQIIAELKDKTKTSTLKTKALTYIEGQLKNTESTFYARFVAMVKADLTSDNSVVMDAVVSYIRTNLKADTAEGDALRKEILTNTELLKQFLANDKMKAEIIKLILKDTFIDKALKNADYRTILVDAVMKDDDFVTELVKHDEFHDYIIDQLHPAEDGEEEHKLATDVEALIQAENSEFRKYVLDLVKHDKAFLELLKKNPKLKQVVLDHIKWSDFVSEDDDLLKYVLRQGATGTYSFINLDDVENAIADEYNKIAGAGAYEALSDSGKQNVRYEIYHDSAKRSEILNTVKSKFDEYKAKIVDDVIDGKADSIKDEKAIEVLDNLLVDYVVNYIEEKKLDDDATINESIKAAIEEILFGFISDLIQGNVPANNFGHELDDMLEHIDAIKHQFVVDASPQAVEMLITIVKDYRKTHPDNINSIINNNYASLTDKLISMIDPNAANSVYSEVESALISVADTVDATLIEKYVKDIDASDKANGTTKLDDLIKKYIKNVTVTDLNTYIASFLYDSVNNKENATNVATVRTEIENFIKDTNQTDTVKDLAITYITDEENETTIKSAVSDFVDDVDETFVSANRSIIEEAIKNIDVTAFVDEQFIKDYIAGLTPDKKTAFADTIYKALEKNNDYKTFMNQLLKGDAIVVNKSNVSLVTAISGAIRGLSFDSVIGFIDNAGIDKLMNIVGTDFIKKLYDDMLKEYCDGLDAVIGEVKESADASIKKSYTTSLTFKMNIFDIYNQLYDKAKDNVVEKVENADLYYDENDYLKFLVDHNILDYLFDYDSPLADDSDFTGYSLKGVIDYYDYMLMLLIVADDALTWYGDRDKLTEKQFEALYDAMFDKIFIVHDKVNEILKAFEEDGELPDKVQGAVEGIDKLNSLIMQYGEKAKEFIAKYLDSSINIKFEDETIAENGKVIKLVDFIIGKEDPVISIDSIYALLYAYDDNIQEKLQAVVETDKFKQAVDKFESTSFGEFFDGKGKLGTIEDKVAEFDKNGRIESAVDSLYDMFYLLAYKGIDAFKVSNDNPGIKERFEFKVGKVIMTVQRSYN